MTLTIADMFGQNCHHCFCSLEGVWSRFSTLPQSDSLEVPTLLTIAPTSLSPIRAESDETVWRHKDSSSASGVNTYTPWKDHPVAVGRTCCSMRAASVPGDEMYWTISEDHISASIITCGHTDAYIQLMLLHTNFERRILSVLWPITEQNSKVGVMVRYYIQPLLHTVTTYSGKLGMTGQLCLCKLQWADLSLHCRRVKAHIHAKADK